MHKPHIAFSLFIVYCMFKVHSTIITDHCKQIFLTHMHILVQKVIVKIHSTNTLSFSLLYFFAQIRIFVEEIRIRRYKTNTHPHAYTHTQPHWNIHCTWHEKLLFFQFHIERNWKKKRFSCQVRCVFSRRLFISLRFPFLCGTFELICTESDCEAEHIFWVHSKDVFCFTITLCNFSLHGFLVRSFPYSLNTTMSFLLK